MFKVLSSKISNLRELDWKYIAVRAVSNILILGALVYLSFTFWGVGKQEVLYTYRRLRGVEFTVGEVKEPEKEAEEKKALFESPFAAFLTKPTPLKVTPKSKQLGLVIEKIGVNAPVVADVNPGNKAEYLAALKRGVAHAKYTPKPGQPGNTYLFAHSALDFWNYGPYAGVFNLLRKLESGDRIVVFYQGRRFDYKVEGKEIVAGYDTAPLLRTYSTPHLTLQTCDPPGVALNRLIVTAELVQ